MKNGKTKNGKDRLDHVEELLKMAAAQTVATHNELREHIKAFNRETREIRLEQKRDRAEARAARAEHKAEMKEIRALFKDMIRRIAV